MTNMKTLAFPAAALSVFSIGAAQAQFVGGPSNVTTVKTVKQVLDNGRDDQMVVLEGNLINQVRNDKYTLRDATGTIVVEIDDRIFAGQRVDSNTKVRVEGEIDAEIMKPNEVEAHRLTVIR